MKIEPGGSALVAPPGLLNRVGRSARQGSTKKSIWDRSAAAVSSRPMNRTTDDKSGQAAGGAKAADLSNAAQSGSAAGQERSDEQLMLDFGQGNSRAFEQLYARHKGGLLRYFRRQCYSLPIAEELFQDTWMKVVRASDRYKPTAKFSTWLYTLAHNRLIDYYRSSGRSVPIAHGDEDALDHVPGPAHQDPVRQTELRSRTDLFFSALDLLPETQREAFLLREESGLSLDEIARVTDVNRETAKSRLRYAVARLRRAMENDE